MLEPFFPRFDRKDEFLPEEEFPDLLSGSALAPFEKEEGTFRSAPSSPDNPATSSERDTFITETARRELETTADFARFLPFDSLQEISEISHPVKDKYLDPRLNANLSRTNLELLYQEWRERDPAGDIRKLAYLLATALHETHGTLQSGQQSLPPAAWNDPNVKAYAEPGYWGRGLVQLTWETAYRKLGEELGLDLLQYPRLAALPTVALDIMGTGLFDAGIAKPLTLDQFFGGANEDWLGARSILGRPDGEQVAELAREIHRELVRYREARDAGQTELSPLDHLHQKTELFGAARTADVLRLLHALGHYQYPHPNFPEASPAQIQYLMDSDSAGAGAPPADLTGPTETAALKRFQQQFNQSHPSSAPLPTDGVASEATLDALFQGGHQLTSGREMIRFAFGSHLAATDLLQATFDRYQRSEWTLPQVAQSLISQLPLSSPLPLQQFFEQLEGTRPLQFAQALVAQVAHHRQLGLLPAELRVPMDTVLTEHQDPAGAILKPYV